MLASQAYIPSVNFRWKPNRLIKKIATRPSIGETSEGKFLFVIAITDSRPDFLRNKFALYDLMFILKDRLLLSRSLTSSWEFCRKILFSSSSLSNGTPKSKTMDAENQDKVGARPLGRFVSVDLKAENRGLNSSGTFRPKDIDFENHVEAFKGKSTKEIFRALCVLRICAVDSFVDNSLKMMTWTKRALGPKGLKILFKPTFYNQFVGGETRREIQDCMKRLSETWIRPMLAATMEEDIGEGGDERVYDSNCVRILECLEIASAEPTPSPMMQLKMSGLLPADLLVSLGNVYTNTEDKVELIRVVAKALITEDLDFKIKAFENVLDQDKKTQLKNALKRLKKIGKEAKMRGVKILVDAEFTYLNPGLSILTMAMAAEYNKDVPTIWNTYQCYLKDALSKVYEETRLASQLKVCLGAKLVRGAYVLQERARSLKLDLPDPVCADYQETNTNYNRVLQFLLNYTKEHWPKFTFIIASHNEESIKIAIKKMKELNIDSQRGGVCFGQLYGMCDQVTYPLAISGYEVYKSIPYGTVDEVLPYLARRAVENKSVLEGSRKEQSLLWKEMKHRMGLKRRRQS